MKALISFALLLSSVSVIAMPQDEGAALANLEARTPEAANCRFGSYHTKQKCHHKCHGGGTCEPGTINGHHRWTCFCPLSERAEEAKAAEPAAALEARATEAPAADDVAHRHCSPGFWDTKKICKHHCHGRGHCKHTINPVAPWFCECPLEERAMEERNAAEDRITEAPTVEARAAAPEPEIEARADDTTGHCIPRIWPTKKVCKKHCHGGGNCVQLRGVDWICECGDDE